MNQKLRLKNFLAVFNDCSTVLVVINADPDAIGSAMAVRRLLWRKVSRVDIAYFNKITRPDNLAMIEYTEPGLLTLDDIQKEDYDRFVIVDSQPDHHERFAEFTFDAVIDHHPKTGIQARFMDIRPEYGTCSAILTGYLKSAQIKPSQRLAAALMIGIKTDTANFSRQTHLNDIKQFQYLYRFADTNIVSKVERAAITEEDLDFLAQAIRQRKIIHNRIFFHAGPITRPDVLVIAADFFLSLVKVNWSIISGTYQGKLIIVIRNDGLRKWAGNTAKKAFSKYGSAGGHKTMARAELDLKQIRKELRYTNKKQLSQWIISLIERDAGSKTE